MDTNTNADRSVPVVSVSLEQLSDAELLAGTRRLVGRSNQLLAELLAHLAEVEARGIHRTRACSSLYVYCIYELRFSEDEAFRRVTAARLVRRFPVLLDALAAGELHLTGLLMLGPHLTDVNLSEVLARAKHRTKREITKLVRVLDPLPAVPARIEPLGPAPARLVPHTPSWQEQTRSHCPVRELVPGDRPRDWMQGANVASANDAGMDDSGTKDAGADDSRTKDAMAGSGGDIDESGALSAALPTAAPERATRRELGGPQRFSVQFTASEEYVELVEEAKALLSHAVRNAGLEEIQLRAMRAFVAELRKRKYATTTASRAPAAGATESVVHAMAAERGQEPHAESHASGQDLGKLVKHTRRRGRHIPAAVRRAVFERDGERCTYVDAAGRRCPETHRLEFHHLTAFARDGAHTPSNVTLRCRAHNALAAEEDFGVDLIEAKKSMRHEPFAARHELAPPGGELTS